MVQDLAVRRGYRIISADRDMDMWKRVGLAVGTSPQIVFDVGANEGQTAKALVQSFSRATVYSFEPDPETYERLVQEAASSRRISTYNCAIGRENSTMTLNRAQNSAGNSLLRLEENLDLGDWTISADQVPVTVRRLDDFCNERDIAVIDILKTDTQGAELDVLKGAGRMLCPESIHAVQCEVIFTPLYRGQAEFCEIHSFLIERGYHLIGLFNEVRNERQEIGWADAAYA